MRMKCSTELSLGNLHVRKNSDENEVLIVPGENSDENEVLDRIVPEAMSPGENSDKNEVLDRIVPGGYLSLGRTRIRMKVLDRIVPGAICV